MTAQYSIITGISTVANNGFGNLCRFLRDSAGWTIPLSGVNGSGPTGDNLGGGDFVIDTDWVCMESPDGAKQVIFARGVNIYYGGVYYSPGANFSGGTGTSRATASDEVVIFETSMFSGFTGVLALYADDASPYGFYALGWNTSLTRQQMYVVWDPLTNCAAGETDPYIWHIGDTYPFSTTSIGEVSDLVTDRRCVGTLGAFGGTIPGQYYVTGSGTIIVPEQGPDNLYNSNEMTWPILYARPSSISNSGYKGVGTIVRWNGQSHTTKDTLASETRMVYGVVNVPWNGTTPP